jgi:glutathione synthase/RimK-type ligase-like ATP-grasp enzyme
MILLISPKNKYSTRRLKEEAEKRGVSITIMDIEALAKMSFQVNVSLFSSLYIRQVYPYFNEVSELARRFKEEGKYVIDGNFIIHGFKTSKWGMYQNLEEAGLPIPHTALLATSYLLSTQYPLVLKWVFGFGGKDVFLVHNQEELQEIKKLHPDSEWLAQDYIKADKEFEVYVTGNTSVPKILAFEIKNGFKADVRRYSVVYNGSGYHNFQKLALLAEQAARAFGMELCKVDILESQGRLYILEVNRTPGLVSFESLIGYNIAGEFVDHLIRKDSHMNKVLNEKPDIAVPPQPVKPQEPVQPQA